MDGSGDRSSLDRSEIENQFESHIVSITNYSFFEKMLPIRERLVKDARTATRGQPIFFVEQTKEHPLTRHVACHASTTKSDQRTSLL